MNAASSVSQLLTSPLTLVAAMMLLTAAIAPNATRRTVEADNSHLSVRNGVTYFDTVPLNGHVIERFADGMIKRDASYRHGKLQGATRGFHMNGTPDYTRTYLNGLEEGEHEGWYDNGQRRFEYHFSRGVSQGVARQWYPNGKPYTLFHFEHGQESGQQQMWDTEGKLRANYVIRDGRRYGLPGSVGCRGAR